MIWECIFHYSSDITQVPCGFREFMRVQWFWCLGLWPHSVLYVLFLEAPEEILPERLSARSRCLPRGGWRWQRLESQASQMALATGSVIHRHFLLPPSTPDVC